MTNLQVEYNKLLETKRNNEAQLAETIRSHQASESIATWRNQQDIAIAQGNLAVNQAKAQTEAAIAAETQRHNRASEELSAWTNAIQQQNANTNAVNATTNRINANTNIANAQTNEKNANTQVMKVANDFLIDQEKNRQGWQSIQQKAVDMSNDLANKQAAQQETVRHNKATEAEAARTNRANEDIRGISTIIDGVFGIAKANIVKKGNPVPKAK